MKAPILLLVYNRPTETEILFEILKKIKPKKIYIAADGPKFGDSNDKINCNKVRKIFSTINWNCQVFKKFNKHNLGCKISISKSIDWFFSKEKEGIILEDDCLPNKDFFNFCNRMLKKYKNNKNIFCISGSNHSKYDSIKSSYYFSKYPHCWGWASWRRAWLYNDVNIKFWPKFKNTAKWDSLHRNLLEKTYWRKIFDNAFKNQFNSWAYSWTLCVWKNKGLTIIPKKNLIKNIGFGQNSVNSFFRDAKDINKNFFIRSINSHPKEIKINEKKDLEVFYHHYKPFNYLYPWRAKYLIINILSNPILVVKKLIKTILN